MFWYRDYLHKICRRIGTRFSTTSCWIPISIWAMCNPTSFQNLSNTYGNILGRINKCGGLPRGSKWKAKWPRSVQFLSTVKNRKCKQAWQDILSKVTLLVNHYSVTQFKVFATRVGPLKCRSPCSTEYIRTFLNLYPDEIKFKSNQNF